MSDERVYNRERKNKFSYDLKNIDLENGYNDNTYNNNFISISSNQRKETTRYNNRIKEYSSKTNDVINRRILITEQNNFSERNNISKEGNSSDLNNNVFYVSRGNYHNNNYKMPYSMYTQPILPIKREIMNTDYYESYNDNARYEINRYLNKNKYSYNDNGGLMEYEKPSSIYNYYNQEDFNSPPIIKRKNININRQYYNHTDNNNINNNMKRKKKILKYKIHDLKELRENEFKIEKSNNDEKDDGNVEEHVEKYFDKDGNCIGGKKVIIKQEYDNGQKIIKKFVEEKYKSNSDYEILKKQGENNYNNPIKKQGKKETIITSTIKSSNNNTIEQNQEEENNNLNTIVTFGMNSKNSKLEEELDSININEEKEADEQKIEINSEYPDDEIKDKNVEENNIIPEEKEENENNINYNNKGESEKLPEEENNPQIIEEINEANGGLNKEIKDINDEKDIKEENENNLNNYNVEENENEAFIENNNENNI